MEIISELSKTPLPTLLVILGAVFLLLAVVERIGTYVKPTAQGRRWAAWIGGAMFVFGIGLYVTSVAVPASSATSTPEMPPCAISSEGWTTYLDGSPHSTLTASAIPDSTCALSLAFDVKSNEWPAAYKKLKPNLLQHSQGIWLAYHGTGARNTLELKLVERDSNGNETIFATEWPGGSATAGKTITKDIRYDSLMCRPGDKSRCPTDGGRISIKPELVDRLDFTISSKPDIGDAAGQGEVIIDGIWIIL